VIILSLFYKYIFNKLVEVVGPVDLWKSGLMLRNPYRYPGGKSGKLGVERTEFLRIKIMD
jgi:hypothetical protein